MIGLLLWLAMAGNYVVSRKLNPGHFFVEKNHVKIPVPAI